MWLLQFKPKHLHATSPKILTNKDTADQRNIFKSPRNICNIF